MSEAIKNRYEFVVLFDVENGNPNGDPDAGNMPRIDPETGYGIVTDVCLKRKIRNYVELVKGDAPPYKIYIKENSILNKANAEAYDRTNIPMPKKGEKVKREDIAILRQFMCDNYYDIRTFGAVMSTEISCGIVRGPVQINFARSIDPIFQQEVTITRVAVTNDKDMDKKTNEMGRKYIVPYGLYRVEGYVSSALAQKCGFGEEDLELLWQAIINMFEDDHSAARGKMAVRKFYIFKHESELGNAPSHKLFDLISVQKKDALKPPRSFYDYTVTVAKDDIPEGVELIERL
ncbi:MAG: type I-C CRISPR-associated protein Cas7/Csd2 [Clostridiales bacterium]|jgi:CRISPR-associated protein Csd2|nr:type I-C CRISPR-associated protein Cas7/Csd2 [Clostridiales bacterium]